MNTQFLLYGSYGYTASLIADQAVKRGLQPILAGRNLNRLQSQASALGMEYRHLALDEPGALDVALRQVPLMLNAAGPFSHTYLPLVKACLRTKSHYLDITGEVAVFEALAALDENARQARVMLLPGVGLDVVPSDCLAAYLKRRLPDATQLSLAIAMWGGSSRGTLLTGIEGIPATGMVRRDGKLMRARGRIITRQIDFGDRSRTVLSIPWGDLSTAFYSTGIPNIVTYYTFPESMVRLARILGPLFGLAKLPLVQGLLKRTVGKMPPGPSTEVRHRGGARIWGEARNDRGQIVRSMLQMPEGHDLTIETALAAVKRVLSGDFKAGFQTPSLAYGADFILEFDGVSRQDLQVITI